MRYKKIEDAPILAQLPIPLATFDTDFRFLSYSDTWLKTHHPSGDCLLGKCLFSSLPNLPIYLKTILTNALIRQDDSQGEQKFECPDGLSVWYSWKFNCWSKPDTTTGGGTLILNNCSHRLRHDELLKETQQVSRTGGWQINLVHFEVLWTKMVNEIHKMPLDYAPLTYEACFEHFLKGEHRNKMYELVSKALEHGTPWDTEVKLKNGNRKNCLGTFQGQSGICKWQMR